MTTAPEVRPSTLQGALRAHAAQRPGQRVYGFLASEGAPVEWITYGELDRQAAGIASHLLDGGAAGDRVLLAHPPGLGFVAAFFGALQAGMVPVPVYTPEEARRSRGSERLTAIARDCNARLGLSAASTLEKGSLSDPALAGIEWTATDDLDEREPRELPNVRDDAVAYLQYTSGSTGTPKGVMVSHANVLHNAGVIADRWGHDESTLAAIWLPTFHDLGLVLGVLEPLCAGFPSLLLSPLEFVRRPLHWLEAISHHRATTTGAPNFAFELCVAKSDEAERAALDLGSVSSICNGAEPIRPRTLDRFAKAFTPAGLRAEAMRPSYGLAEATLVVSTSSPKEGVATVRELEDGARRAVAVGSVLTGQRVEVVDPGTRMPRPQGEEGELWVSGPSVCGGYWGRPEESRETFRALLATDDSAPFLRTGDLGFVDEHQRLYVTGRLKDLIIVRGRNVYPQDVEWTVEDAHESLRPGCGAAFSIDAGEEEEQLAILHEVDASRMSDPAEVIARVRRAVAAEHGIKPTTVVLVEPRTLTKTSSGKIARAACREALLTGRLATVSEWAGRPADTPAIEAPSAAEHAPAGMAEALTAWLLQRVADLAELPLEEADAARPLAELGLDSADLVTIATEVEQRVGRRLPTGVLYTYPTIRDVVGYLTGASTREQPRRRRRDRDEPIAIVGMACRLPGARDVGEFWALLRDRRDAISEVPSTRWDVEEYYDPEGGTPGKMVTRWGGFLDDVDEFDASFFGIGNREARSMDPQQRIALEVVWDALADAGIAPEALSLTQTGVFMGVSSFDYMKIIEVLAPRDIVGNAATTVANRVSYLLNANGPSFALDSACSSSLVAVHQACQSLLSGESDCAIAGGVNVILIPDTTAAFSQAGVMAPDGRCKPFDAAADGTVRSEGCGAVLLKRLSDAVADGDSVRAVIRGSAVNNDGRSNGLGAPNGLAQQAVIHAAHLAAEVRPQDVGFLEAHGTGTYLGDPLEVEALAAVFRGADPDGRRCYLGAAKANIGHTEPAAGVAGLVKAVLVLEQGEIPGQINFETPNPLIDLEGTRLAIPSATTAWDFDRGARVAGVSAFGAGGTNAHVVVGEAPAPVRAPRQAPRASQLLCLSAHKPRALNELAQRYVEVLESEPDLASVCFSAATGRSHQRHRVALTGGTCSSVAQQLRELANHEEPEEDASQAAPAPRVAFLFPGQGSAYAGMGNSLHRTEPSFIEAIERCEDLLRGELDKPLLTLLDPASGTDLSAPLHQPVLFAVEYAVASMWMAWGIQPAAVLGHSLGEYVAACVAGCLTLAEGLALTAERGRLQERSGPAREGEMIAVIGDPAEVLAEVEPYRDVASVAAVNGPSNVVISGTAAAMADVGAALEGRGMLIAPLRTGGAGHSPLLDPILPEFERAASGLSFAAPRLPFVSNVTGRPFEAGDRPDAAYWASHMRQPVQFKDGVDSLARLGCNVFLEAGPGSTLIKLSRRCLPPDEGARRLPTMAHDRDDLEVTLESLATLYHAGVEIDWHAFYAGADVRRLRLPGYPWQRRRFWATDLARAVPAI